MSYQESGTYSKMVKYKQYTLAKNSFAYRLWLDKEFDRLDKHLKQVEANEKALLAKYK